MKVDNKRKEKDNPENTISMQKVMPKTEEGSNNNNTQMWGTMSTLFVMGGSWRHPFVESIMEVPLPSDWKSLIIDWYDDNIDLDEHVDIYVTQVNVYITDDSIMCRVFPTTLRGRH